ncbi:hypothetical protein RB195_009286 [Necator americanus]|uniref:PHLPP-like RA domain-containing protein n=1 Tax=Necator americanus TaxID=51031 RepID=A0ABR1CSP1_NECAM
MISAEHNCDECPSKPGPSTKQPSSPSSASGRIRLFSPEGDRSALATISLDTTAVDLAKAYEVDSIYLQIGNLHIRNLSPKARPLLILREFLASLGHSENAILTRGTDLRFRHLIAFFLGRPVLQPNSVVRSEILVDMCDVRRGKLVHRWSRHKCLLYNGCLRIQKETGEDEVVGLSRCRVDVCDTRRGRCLRVQNSTSVILLRFDDSETLALWSTRCRQATTAQVGWLDDLTRLVSLTSLDLSSNRLSTFPLSITELINLRKLNMASNCIQTVPPNVRLLKRLTSLDLENNWISLLPPQLADCDQLIWLNLKFNRIKQVPEEILLRLPHLIEWSLAGNYIESVTTDQQTRINRLDLRRTSLCGCFRLPSSCFDQLTFLDIRDNCNVSTVHLTNMPSLQVLHCERLQLTSLHLNGQSLTHLHAHHNMLDCLIIMPVPLHLVFMDISYNNFESIPDWICDLPQIDCLRVNNNRLSAVPERLRHLNVSFNRLTSIPSVSGNIDRNRINTLRLSGNRLDESIVPILMKMRRMKVLDISHNKLRYFDDSALGSLTLLEELNLSSNELSTLSSSIFDLSALQVLRAHSNRVRTIPDLSASPSLQV